MADQRRQNMRALKLQPERQQQQSGCRTHQEAGETAGNQPCHNNEHCEQNLNSAEITIQLPG